MRFGLDTAQQRMTWAENVSRVQLAEDLGFDGVWGFDHFQPMYGEGPGECFEGQTTLAAWSGVTERIRLGLLVAGLTYRHPSVYAAELITIDHASGGRVECSYGAAWFAEEHGRLGIDFPDVRERVDAFEEAVQIVRGLLTTDGFTFEGRHYAVRDATMHPRSVQRPHPPIIIGGFGARRTPMLAARHAAEFNLPFADLETFGTALARVDAACQAIDRDPVTMLRSVALCVACGEDEDEVDRRATAAGHDPTGLREYGLAGTPDQVVAKIETYRAASAQSVYLQVLDLDDLEHLDLIAARVLPEVSS